MDGEQLWQLVEGLEANGLCMQYTHLLTGGTWQRAKRSTGLVGQAAMQALGSAMPQNMHEAHAQLRPTSLLMAGQREVVLCAGATAQQVPEGQEVACTHFFQPARFLLASSGILLRKYPSSHGPPSAGYIGSLSVLQTIVKVAEKLRQYNPNLVYGEHSCGATLLMCWCGSLMGTRPATLRDISLAAVLNIESAHTSEHEVCSSCSLHAIGW